MEHLSFVRRDPNKGYFGRQLWLPKAHINCRSLKAGLEFPVMDEEGITFLQLWEETEDHLIVPREYVPRKHYPTLSFPIVSVQPPKFSRVRIKSNVILDFKEPKKTTQRIAFAAMKAAKSGILNLRCGGGKTNIALHHIALRSVPALVVVNNTTLIDQWRNRIEEFLEIEGGVGVAQGPPNKWKWEGKSIVMAMLQSVALRHEELPVGFDRYFGGIYYDECFVPGTLVDGVPIEKLKVGDLVWAFDEHTNNFSRERIKHVHSSIPKTNALVSVLVKDEEFTCTPTHPFWTKRGWVPAAGLRYSDEVILPTEHPMNPRTFWAPVKDVKRRDQTSDGTFGNHCPGGHVFNLEVENVPTYTVGKNNLVVHNCHHLSAPLFSTTAPLFYGERHGLTATTDREDGLEPIYQYHLGDVYHKDLRQDMTPRIYFQQCPLQIDTKDKEVYKAIHDKRGMLNIPKLRTYIGTLPECNQFIAKKLQPPLDSGRKILALSHSVEQLRILNEMFSDSGLCTGAEKPKDRIATLRAKQITFGTLQLVKEALDEEKLDTLFFLTPFGSNAVERGGANTLQQGMGRIQRFRKGKKTPVVVIIDFLYILKFHRMCNKLKQLIRSWPEEQGGPLDYTILRPHAGDIKGSE